MSYIHPVVQSTQGVLWVVLKVHVYANNTDVLCTEYFELLYKVSHGTCASEHKYRSVNSVVFTYEE